MPHYWNNIMVVTQDEIVPRFYKTDGTLKSEVSRYKDRDFGIKKVQRGGNGRPALYSFDSLPIEMQNAIGDPRKITNPLELFYKEDREAVRFYTSFKFEDKKPLKMVHQNEYIINASVLGACVGLKEAREYQRRSKGGSLKGVMTSICDDVKGFNQVLKLKHHTEHTLPSSEKRFKETFKKFAEITNGGYNYRSLISGHFRNENRKVVTDELLELLNNIFAGAAAKPTRTEVSRQYEAFLSGYIEVINTETGEQYDPQQFKPIDDSTIINYLGKWGDHIGTKLKRSGDRQKYIGQNIPYHKLSMPEFAGEILSIDDRQPPFEYIKGQRAWFYMGIDIASQAWTVWVHGKSKEGIIVDFYRQLIRNYTQWGFKLPAELECESSLNSMFKTTFLREGAMFDYVRIEANNARGKYIERMFGKLRYEKEKHRAGWIARPFARKEDNQSGGYEVPIVPYDHIVNNSLRDIEDWNNSPHPDHEGMSRWDVFASKQHPALKQTNWPAILPYIGFKTETSCNAGIIKLNGGECFIGDDGSICTGKRLIELMKEIEGRNIDVYWLDDNEGNVLKALVCIKGDDVIICEAIPQPTYSRSRIGRTAEDEKKRSIVSAYVNTIEAYARERKNKIEEVLIIDNRPTTLNRRFVIPGLERKEEQQDVSRETETVNTDEREEYTPAYTSRKSLKDRI